MPVVGVSIAYDVGGRHEAPGKTGLAHLFEHMMFQGSRNVGKMEHFSRLNAVGGIVNGGTSQDMTIYHETVPSEHLELALYLEADRLGTLLDTLTQEKFDNQRDVVKNERGQGMDNVPYGVAGEKMLERLFPAGHPYHHTEMGSMHDLDGASLDDVSDFFRTYYAVNNATLTIAGDFAPDRARRLVHKHFDAMEPNPNLPPAPDMSAPERVGDTVRETVPDNVSLSRVYLGYRGPAVGGRDISALQVALAVLSAGPWSRLSTRLVRARLAQDASIGIDPSMGPSAVSGQATARAGVDVAEVEQIFTATVEGLAVEPVTDTELARARALLERGHMGALQTAMDRANQLGIYSIVWRSPEALNRELETLLSVDTDEATAAAERFLRADNRVTLVFLPR